MERLGATRGRAEELERAGLSTWAALAVETKGRDVPEDPDPHRTAYQQDVDRIVASRAFRRLAGKTHDGAPGDPSLRRTRLEHALALARTARAMARGLRLNEDLAEAVALGSGLGAPAFGPAGEQALAALSEPAFRAPEQSRRVVEHLEGGGEGLNLTWEVRDGIAAAGVDATPAATLEGQLVRVAGRTLDVASRWAEGSARRWLDDGLASRAAAALGGEPRAVVGVVVDDVIRTSGRTPEVLLSRDVGAALDEVADVLDDRVARHPHRRVDDARVQQCLHGLGLYYLEHPGRLPAAGRGVAGEPDLLRVLDHLADLTDVEAVASYRERFLPAG